MDSSYARSRFGCVACGCSAGVRTELLHCAIEDIGPCGDDVDVGVSLSKVAHHAQPSAAATDTHGNDHDELWGHFIAMRIRDNVRSMLSTTVGIAGGGVALTGWLVKAFTPNSSSAATKVATGVATGLTVAGATYGALTFLTPATLTLLGIDVSVYASSIGGGVLALYTGACTSASYFLGGSAGGGSSSAPTSSVAREAEKITKARTPNFLK